MDWHTVLSELLLVRGSKQTDQLAYPQQWSCGKLGVHMGF